MDLNQSKLNIEALELRFGELIEILPTSNSGFLVVNNIQIYFKNTCSIDYFLIICIIISRKIINQLNSKKKSSFELFLVEVFNLISLNNNFDLVRNAWLGLSKGILKQRKQDAFYYDCMTDESTSYLSFYREYQRFQWKSYCPNANCIVNTQPVRQSDKFTLM
jgi:hypothetical protein